MLRITSLACPEFLYVVEKLHFSEFSASMRRSFRPRLELALLSIPPTGPIPDGSLLIGDVAELTGLSLRSIRHYEEMGLAVSDSRTAGGFRVFGAEAVQRLRLVMTLRLMDLSLEEILPLVDACRAAESGKAAEGDVEALAMAQTMVEERLDVLKTRVEFGKQLTERLRKAANDAAIPSESAVAEQG